MKFKTVHIEKDIHEDLRLIAFIENCSLQALCNALLREYVEKTRRRNSKALSRRVSAFNESNNK
jgi:hypothetical protein